MKNLLILIVSSCCIFMSCKKEELDMSTSGVSFNIHTDISVIQKNTGEDLLNPKSKNSIKPEQIKFELLYDPDKAAYIGGWSSNKLIIYEKDGVYRLRVFPTMNTLIRLTEEEYSVNIIWPDGSKDKITFYITYYEKSGGHVNTILVNDKVVSPPKDGKKGVAIPQEITIYK